MKKFSFRLQRLLDLAKRKEELARTETARSLGSLRLAEDAYENARQSVENARQDIAGAATDGSLEPSNIAFLYQWLANAELKQAELEARLVEEEKAYEKVRAIMIERRKELLSLEKAQEKAWERWQEESRREELATTEEIASFRHMARKRGEE